MPSRLALALLMAGLARPTLGQAVTSWTSPAGVPVAVVEVAGGDLEHLAAMIPPAATVPPDVAGWPTRSWPRRGGTAVVLSVPASIAPGAVDAFLATLGTVGSAAIVALGPLSVRDLAPATTGLASVPYRPLPPARCVIAEGGNELLRGTPERVELRVQVPGPEDPRFDLLPPFTAWVQSRLESAVGGARVTVEEPDGCPALTIRAPADSEHPRVITRRLRETLAALPLSRPREGEADTWQAAGRRALAAAARDGALWATALVERMARGGSPASAVAPLTVDASTLASLATDVLRGHPGFATLVESERRSLPTAPVELENGLTLVWRMVPGEIGTVGVAIGGCDPVALRPALEVAAAAAAARGWSVEAGSVAGVATLALSVPATELSDALEQLGDAVAALQLRPVDDLTAAVDASLGLAAPVAAESVAVALGLPEESDEGREAAAKFFAGVPPGGVRSAPAMPTGGLAWTVAGGPAEIAAIIEVAPSAAGWLAAGVLTARLEREEGVRCRRLVVPGRELLEVRASGGAHVPALDSRMAAAWRAARAALAKGEVEASAHRAAVELLGDAPRATARAAAAVLIPALPRVEELLAVEHGEVGGALQALPAWEALPRIARGPAPPAPTPGRGAVRQSPPHRP